MENEIKVQTAEEKEEQALIAGIEQNLTPAEQKKISEIRSNLDLTDTLSVMQFGAEAQQKITEFSDSALANVRTQDLGEVGDMIVGLVGELKSFDGESKNKGFFGLFRKAGNKVETLKAKYDKTEVNVDKICTALETHQVQLLKDISMLDKLYDMNLQNFRELTLYIEAGRKALEEARSVQLKEYTDRAAQTGLPEDAQKAKDFSSFCDRFEKKLHDLELTRTIALQMGPQIRLVQNNDNMLAEKIQSTMNNTIPLWKSQIVIALGLAHSEQAMKAERAVNDMTNELLKKNADMLRQGTSDIARESERGIVDTETLTYTNEQLIATLDEVMQIQEEGKTKREAARTELARIETELKNKLLAYIPQSPSAN